MTKKHTEIMEKTEIMKNTQKQLDRLYIEYLDKIFSSNDIYKKVEDFTFSSPLFIDLQVKNGKIAEKEYKLLFVGQQTKGWFNKRERKELNIKIKTDYLNALKELYIEFNYGDRLEENKYNGYLWQFQRPLLDKINEKVNNKFGLLWSNLVRVDENQGKIDDKDTIEKIAYNNNEILRKEIEIIKPDAVVFVTGYSYDWLLEKTFDDLIFKQSANENLNIRKLAILESEFLPKLSFRTYHPRPLYQNPYLRTSRDEIIDSISRIISNEIK